MNTAQKLEAAKEAVGNQLQSHIDCYTCGMAVRVLYEELKVNFLFRLGLHPGAGPFDIQNATGYILGLCRSSMFAEFAALKVAHEINEASDEFKQAYSTMQPLLDRVAELEAELQAEAAAYAEKLHAVTAAEEVAMEKARLAMGKDPTVSKLRDQAEAARPRHIEPPVFEEITLTRGRVKLATDPEPELSPA